ncbi:hypothetical protein BP5796_00727 [Coleophoma crateriformis]|uniref:Uncharacterized protein n=1 Tax=Coleophoma crateriformis TaxID=565419 RepID=A0A3D8T8W7_9HELO|nr:hypothetical protein BP5796_00727 [Coleophoma crateriformis]
MLRSRFRGVWVLVLFFLFFLWRVVNFIQIFSAHSGPAITQEQIKVAVEANSTGRPEYIPKIIHQVYHDWSGQGMPADWDQVAQKCKDVNPGWAYKGCQESFTPLIYYPAFTTDGGRGALSNNVLGSRPNHPFWKLMTDSLQPYNYDYFFPYVTISWASGQWFETDVWERYQRSHPLREEDQIYRVMMDDRPGSDPWVFFTHERGGTWVNWDNRMFLWIGDHLWLIGLAVGAVIVLPAWVVIMIACPKRKGSSGEDIETAERRASALSKLQGRFA